LRDMPKVYVRRHQSKIDDLYEVLLTCDVSRAISDKRRKELLTWLWRQMEHAHTMETAPHLVNMDLGEEIDPLPKDMQLVQLYHKHCILNAHAKNPAERAKAFLMKEFGLKKEALEKALYRARKKYSRITKSDLSDVPF
jgi:hypothetical protein